MVSVRRVAPVLLLVMALPVFGAKKSSSQPPRDLHRVGDHWTAYNPPDPSTYPAGAKTYEIKAGDTLWALAQQFYGNAYLWPQLWESNTWITDAHWIYPGDVLLVEGETGPATAGAQTTTTTGTTTATGESTLGGGTLGANQPQTPDAATAGTAIGAEIAAAALEPQALATDADIYCYGYLGDPNEAMPNYVESFEDVELLYQPGVLSQTNGVASGALVFVSGGTASGINAGETYILIEPGDLVTHPRTGEVLGRHYDYRGQIRILCADENHARAIISQSCKEIHLGARLKPVPQLPIPIARIPELPAFCDGPSGKTAGFIVSSDGWTLGLGIGNLVQINIGREEQLQPGDFLTVFRESPIAGQPRQVLGELGVLTTEGHTATAKVVSMRLAMQVGDRVEMR